MMKEREQQMTYTKNKKLSYPEKEAYLYIRKQFAAQGITIREMAKEAKADQDKHGAKASLDTYIKAIQNQLHKHDVMSCIMTGLALDRLAEQHKLPEPLQTIIENDLPLYSTDELISISLTQMYSGIAVTNYGARDVHKHALAKRIDDSTEHVNCFLDDIISAIIAGAEAAVANKLEEHPEAFVEIDKEFE